MTLQRMPQFPTRTLTVIAQDPSVLDAFSKDPKRKILTARLDVPNEDLEKGPRGHRVQVIDYDTTTNRFRAPSASYRNGRHGNPSDPFLDSTDETLLDDAGFHAQNVYAIVMRLLARFEFALGRRLTWGFSGHQLTIAPHAFVDANAFYSRQDNALMFGYFPSGDGSRNLYTCLSHDVVAHEATHALLDGLRERYLMPSSPDQAAFHEAFADICALLTILSQEQIVQRALLAQARAARVCKATQISVPLEFARDPKHLRASVLFGLADEMGSELLGKRRALRRSVELPENADYLDGEKFPEFCPPHRRGEVLVAVVMNVYLAVWSDRVDSLRDPGSTAISLKRMAEEGSAIADYLLTMAIRALDYCPPTDILFQDFASALLTADFELHPNDSRYRFRDRFRTSLPAYGIRPPSTGEEPCIWAKPAGAFDYGGVNLESMQDNPEEVFRFVWQNRDPLRLSSDACTKVQSVRPCRRFGNDGFLLRETVAEYCQILTIQASELKSTTGLIKPADMPDHTEVTLYGGSALIFDQFGHLKYAIGTGIFNRKRQQERLDYLWQSGYFDTRASMRSRLASLHRMRAQSWLPAIAREEAIREEVSR
jgi:hypothetical protein